MPEKSGLRKLRDRYSVTWPRRICGEFLEKGSTPPNVNTAFGLALIRGVILEDSAGLTYATPQFLMSASSL